MPVALGVAIFGAVGATARYAVDRFIEGRSSMVFPLSTFAINVSGCFLVGLISATVVDRHHLPAWFRVGLVVGGVGGYTTFSTFAQEALDVDGPAHAAIKLVYVVASVAFGMSAVAAGTQLGRLL